MKLGFLSHSTNFIYDYLTLEITISEKRNNSERMKKERIMKIQITLETSNGKPRRQTPRRAEPSTPTLAGFGGCS